MALSINYPDKILAGVWQSYTVTSEEGPPDGEVLVDGKSLARKFIHMRAPKYKVTFLLPDDAAGKKLTFKLRNGGGSACEESKEITKA